MRDGMIILKPIADERVWGGTRLFDYVKEEKHPRIGHLYSVISNDEFVSKIISPGPYEGKSIDDYFNDIKSRYGLEMFNNFPVVIALVDATENLSIQVHPDDKVALETENFKLGKNESWYFLEAPADGSIINGCICKSKPELKERFERGEYDGTVDRLNVEKGDYVFCEAGTLHALTAGSTTYEIEENCDLTYRFYDYGRLDADGRPRKMQMEKALRSVDTLKKSKACPMGGEVKSHRGYDFFIINDLLNYVNESNSLECFSMLKGSIKMGPNLVECGMTIILEPGESIDSKIECAAVVRPKSFKVG